MFIVILIVIIVLIVVLKVKKNKSDELESEQREAEWKKAVEERKKNGEPSVCEVMPSFDKYGNGKKITGPDGREYPKAAIEKNYIRTIREFLQDESVDYLHKKYEISPVFSMIAMEYDIHENFYGGFSYHKPEVLTQSYVQEGFDCIYELAENYAYSVMSDKDLTQAEHYTVRRLIDRKRAMEGNGYYKNAYNIPVNLKKALNFYEMPERLRVKYPNYIGQVDKEHVMMMVRCWLQTAHIYSAQQKVEKARKLYSQVYQMAVHYSLDDLIVELIHALTSGYPRNPEDYADQAYNMQADWACNSDIGLAMYVEYVLYANALDKQQLAKSPEKLVKYCKEEAENNHYSAYLLGRAMLYGYGTAKDEAHGRMLIEAAAENGCVSALYLLTQLSIGNKEESKWKTALDKTVATTAEKCAFMRNELQQDGKSITKAKFAEIKSKLEAENKKQKYNSNENDNTEMNPDKKIQDGQDFIFPRFIYDEYENPWELMNSGYDNATYYCQKTGETSPMFYKSDFEYGAPSGFHLR